MTSLRQTFQDTTGKVLSALPWICLVTVAILLTNWQGFSVLPFSGQWVTTQTTQEVRNLIISGLKDASDLTTVYMSTKATVVTNQAQKLAGIPLGDTNLVYEGVGTVRAGIDISKLEAKTVDPDHHKIHVLLPAAHITDTTLDVNRSNILAHYRNWLGPNAELELQENAQREALRKIQTEACENNILEAANNNAAHLIEQILRTSGYQEITIETQLPQTESCAIA